MLSMQNISKVYRAGLVETHALREFSLEVKEGEFVSVTGPSGSGKTTFLNIAGMLEQFTSGRYELDGQDVSSLSDSQASAVRNEKIGFVFQSFNLVQQLTILENIEVPLFYQGIPRVLRRQRSEELAEMVGLADRAGHRPRELSGGQQQRVAIARALASDPLIVLADEPTGNLDSSTTHEILELFDKLHHAGKTIITVTHENDVAAHSERTIVLADGMVVSDTSNEPASARR